MSSPAERTHSRIAWLGALTVLGLTACGAPTADAPNPERVSLPPAVNGGTQGLGIIGLTVRDLPASLAFYRRLGLAVPDNVDTRTGTFRLPQPNGQILFWETVQYVRRFDPTYSPGTGDRRVILEFGFTRPDDVNAMYDKLLATGAEGRLPPTTWNNGAIRYAIVTDPDGNQISLRWPLVS